MSTRSRLRELSGPNVEVREVPRVSCGTPARFLLRAKASGINVPLAALALAKRHSSLEDALAVMERLLAHGETVVDLPLVERAESLIAELEACNVTAKVHDAPG